MSDGSKEIILQKIRKALSTPVAQPFPEIPSGQDLYISSGNDLAIGFAEQFVSLQGKFSWCQNRHECKIQIIHLIQSRGWKKLYCADSELRSFLNLEWTDDLAGCDAAITTCEALVARTGSIVLSSAQTQGRTASVYAPIHICIAFSNQLVPDIAHAIDYVNDKYQGQVPSLLTFASGPSRTADIEKTLVTGVHGPKEVFCFLLEE
ncbi:MAG: lactate utilization protein [Chitinophagaceae bacterium]|nr:lactate utilization protein [Chitinophagaceae bacterium]